MVVVAAVLCQGMEMVEVRKKGIDDSAYRFVDKERKHAGATQKVQIPIGG